MMDQQQKFSQCLSCEYVGEGVDSDVRDRVVKGKVQQVFITPETLMLNKAYRNMLLLDIYQESLVAFVIDKAHCIKTWGDEFRKTFAEIGEMRSLIPTSVNILALTATATHETYHVVVKRLAMKDPKLIALSPFRDNISYQVKPKCEVEELTDAVSDGLLEKQTFQRH